MVDSKISNENDNVFISEEEKLTNQAVTAAINEIRTWIEKVTYKTFKYPNSLQNSLFDGIILCSLINALKPGTIKKINRLPNVMSGYDSMFGNDNIVKFLQCCEEDFGLSKLILFEPADLDPSLNENDDMVAVDKRSIRVLLCLYHLIECVQSDMVHVNHIKLNSQPFTMLMQTKDQLQLRKRQHQNDDSNNSNVEKVIMDNKRPNYLAERAQETITKTEANKPSNNDDWQERLENWREKRRMASSVSQDYQNPSTPNAITTATTPSAVSMMPEDDREMLELKEKARKMKQTRNFISQISDTAETQEWNLSHVNPGFSASQTSLHLHQQLHQQRQQSPHFFTRSIENLAPSEPQQPQQAQLSIDAETMRMIEKLKKRKEREAEKWKPRPTFKKTPFDTDSDRSSQEDEEAEKQEVNRHQARRSTIGDARTKPQSSVKPSQTSQPTVTSSSLPQVAVTTNTNTVSSSMSTQPVITTNNLATVTNKLLPVSADARMVDVKLIQQSVHDKDSLWGLELAIVDRQVQVNKVKLGSCADICDIRRGDVISSVNGQLLSDHIQPGTNPSIDSVEIFLKNSQNLVAGDSILFKISRTAGDDDDDEFMESDFSDSIEDFKDRADSSKPDVTEKTLQNGILNSEHQDFEKEQELVPQMTKPEQLPAPYRHISEGDSLGSDYELLNDSGYTQPKHAALISTGASPRSSTNSPCHDTVVREPGRVISVQQKVALFESQQQQSAPGPTKKPLQQQHQHAKVTNTAWNSAVTMKNATIENQDRCDGILDPQQVKIPQTYSLSSSNDLYNFNQSPNNSINQSYNATIATQSSAANYNNCDLKSTKSTKQPMATTISTTLDSSSNRHHSKKAPKSNMVAIETTELDIDDSLVNIEASKTTKKPVITTTKTIADDNDDSEGSTSEDSDEDSEEETSDDVSALNETIMLTPGRYNKPLVSQNSRKPNSNHTRALSNGSSHGSRTVAKLPTLSHSGKVVNTTTASSHNKKKVAHTPVNAAIQADLLSNRSSNQYNPPKKMKPIKIMNVTTSVEAPTYQITQPDDSLVKQQMITPQVQRMEHSPNPDFSLQQQSTSSSLSYNFNRPTKKNESSQQASISLTSHLFPMKQKNLFNKEKNNSEHIQELPQNMDMDFEEDATLRTDPFKSDDFEDNQTLSAEKDRSNSPFCSVDAKVEKKQKLSSKSVPMLHEKKSLSLSLTPTTATAVGESQKTEVPLNLPPPHSDDNKAGATEDLVSMSSTVPAPSRFATSVKHKQQRNGDPLPSLESSSSPTTPVDIDTSSFSSESESESLVPASAPSRSLTPVRPIPPSSSYSSVTNAAVHEKIGAGDHKETVEGPQLGPHTGNSRTQRSANKRNVSFSDDTTPAPAVQKYIDLENPEKVAHKLTAQNPEEEIVADHFTTCHVPPPSISTPPVIVHDKRKVNHTMMMSHTSSKIQTKEFSIDHLNHHHNYQQQPHRKDAKIKSNSASSSSADKPPHKAKAIETKCHICGESVGSEDLMVIEELQLHFHLRCFRCSVCDQLLCDGTSDTDVRVRRSKLHCVNCYMNKSKSKTAQSLAHTNLHNHNNSSSNNHDQHQKLKKYTPKHQPRNNDTSNHGYHNSVTITTNSGNQPPKYSQKVVLSTPVIAAQNSNNQPPHSKGIINSLIDPNTERNNNTNNSAHSSPRSNTKSTKKSVKITPKFIDDDEPSNNAKGGSNSKKKWFPFNL